MKMVSICFLSLFAAGCVASSQNQNFIEVGARTTTVTAQSSSTGSPVMSLIAAPTMGTDPLLVTFTAQCSTCVAYAWDFGDGTSNVLPGSLQKHTYSAGSYYALVVATDMRGHQASAQAIVNVSCGSSTVPACSKISVAPIVYPHAAPNVGSILGAGATFVDPVFGTPGVRITDGNFDPSMVGSPNNNYTVSNGGSSDDNWWSTDSNLTLVGSTGSWKYLVGLNPATLQVTRPYAAVTKGCPRGNGNCSTFGGWSLSGNLEFSQTDPCKLYLFSGTTVSSYTFGSDVVPFANSCSAAIGGPPPARALTNFIENSPIGCIGTACNALPSDFGTPTWMSQASTVADDVLFGAAFSSLAYHYGTTTGQGTGCYAAIWSPAKGGMSYNTCSGMIKADPGWAGGAGLSCNASGCTGAVSGSRFTIHNAKFNGDGSRLIIQWTTCISGTCVADNPFTWVTGTTTVYESEGFTKSSGHWCGGYLGIINAPGNPARVWYYRTNPANGVPGSPIALNSTPAGSNLDAHCGWQMGNSTDTSPFVWTSTTASLRNWGLLPFDQPDGPWWSEIDLTDTNGDALTHREALTFNSGYSTIFSVAQNITTASRQCVAVGSDWFNIRNAGGTSSTCIPKGPTWHASYAYAAGYTITPAAPNNLGGYSYQVAGACHSGGTQPGTWNQAVGGAQTDAGCTWTNVGVPSGANACGTDVYAWCAPEGLVRF